VGDTDAMVVPEWQPLTVYLPDAMLIVDQTGQQLLCKSILYKECLGDFYIQMINERVFISLFSGDTSEDMTKGVNL
jgi:hypothetical protein